MAAKHPVVAAEKPTKHCERVFTPPIASKRLATPILKAWLDELAAEQDSWAISIIRDHDDALSWRAHEQAIEQKRLVCGPPKPKARPRGRPYIAQGLHGPSTRDLPPVPKPQPAQRSIYGGGFDYPGSSNNPEPSQPITSSVRPLPTPATAMPAPETRREEMAAARIEARKAELRNHCVICRGGIDDVPHQCERFQVA